VLRALSRRGFSAWNQGTSDQAGYDYFEARSANLENDRYALVSFLDVREALLVGRNA